MSPIYLVGGRPAYWAPPPVNCPPARWAPPEALTSGRLRYTCRTPSGKTHMACCPPPPACPAGMSPLPGGPGDDHLWVCGADAAGDGMGAQNSRPVDSWTLIHILSGMAAGAAGMRFPTLVGLTVVYEVLEYIHEHPRGSIVFGSKQPESAANIVVDLLAAYAGYFLIRRL